MSASDQALKMAISQIRSTPAILQSMIDGATQEDLAWKPQPSRYSVAEVLAHMAHVDENCFGPRLAAVLTEDNPNLPTYDDASFLEAGHAFVSDSSARMAGLAETRNRWMATAEQITASNGDRHGTHPTFGAITASQLLLEWAFHDLGHVRQIAELLRARCYYPGIGPFQTYYTVRP